MKLLLIHANSIEWKATKKAIKEPEKTKENWVRIEEPLVAFTAVEKIDGSNEEKRAKETVKEILDVYREVKAKKVVIYPYAHLSSDLADPKTALSLLKNIEKELKNEKIEVYRAPFGWYKAFKIDAKGHPLSELSRSLTEIKEEENKAVKAERKLISHWHILTPKGELKEIKVKNEKIVGFDFSKNKNLEKFAEYEISKNRASNQEPPHVRLMRSLELVDYEPGSDPGNFRYYPKGKLIKSLLEDFVTQKVIDYGAMEVETPIMYDYEHPALKNYLQRFPARQYTIQTPNKKVFLRFSACFGQFLMFHDANISYKQLPARLYELTRYSFRVEQRGELSGLRRLRAFTMPDCHAFCANMEQAKEEFMKRFELAWEVQQGIGFKIPQELEMAIRATRKFYNENKDFVVNLVKKWGKPVILELWDDQFFYFVFKYEWNFVDNLGKAAALNTDQIDVENAKRYEITYVDEKGKKKYPLILHLSPSGAIERDIYALLEREYMKSKDRKPEFPLWLSPTQIRICPVSDNFIPLCEKIAEKFEKENIRVDIDDRNESVSRKILDSEQEWVPITIVIGEKEKNGKLKPRIRNVGEKEMDVEELIKYVHEKTRDFPFKKLSLPLKLSKRPKFVG